MECTLEDSAVLARWSQRQHHGPRPTCTRACTPVGRLQQLGQSWVESMVKPGALPSPEPTSLDTAVGDGAGPQFTVAS